MSILRIFQVTFISESRLRMKFLLYVLPLLAATSAIVVDPEAAKDLFDCMLLKLVFELQLMLILV